MVRAYAAFEFGINFIYDRDCHNQTQKKKRKRENGRMFDNVIDPLCA